MGQFFAMRGHLAQVYVQIFACVRVYLCNYNAAVLDLTSGL